MRGLLAHTGRRLLGPLAVALAAAAAAPATAPAQVDTAAAAAPSAIVEQPVSFTVQNVNRTKIACLSDGATYTLKGTLVAPTSRFAHGNRAITLWLHGLTASGNFLFRLKDVPGYDFAREEASKGHASLVLDALGYGASSIPDGKQICPGSLADTAHQVIQEMRSGAYTLNGSSGLAWERVGLGGASLGGIVTEIETYSFADADTEINVGWADQGYSPLFGQNADQYAQRCTASPEPKYPGSPGGYVYTWDDKSAFYQSPNPAVVEAHRHRQERDPCGIGTGFFQTVSANQALLKTIAKPVLLMYGAQDQLYLPGTFDQQKQEYTGASDLTLEVIPGAGHLPLLDGPAPQFRQAVSDWLSARGF